MQLNKHPILWQAHELTQAIEKCGASVPLTEAVIKASALGEAIEKLIDAHVAERDALQKMHDVLADERDSLKAEVTRLREELVKEWRFIAEGWQQCRS